MNVEVLNSWAERALSLVWPMLWQSSLLIGLLLGLDLIMRGRVQAAVRYALWLIVLVKLMLPPSLALPTGAGWWLRPPAVASAQKTLPLVVTTASETLSSFQLPAVPPVPPPAPPRMSAGAWGLVFSTAIGVGLLLWMLARWARVALDLRRAAEAPDRLWVLLEETRRCAGVRGRLRLRLTEQAVSPAVCGLFRPVLLVPRALIDQLPEHQLRAILLHELVHVRRGDVWVNCLQSLLQVVYWWHPLLWVANARIRRVREEAVDDAVMQALGRNAEQYAPTLLQVARLTLRPRLATMALLGILESSGSLRRRIERLLNFRAPTKSGLRLLSLVGIVGFAAVAVPMGQAPAENPAAEIAGRNGSRGAALVQDGRLLYEMGKLDEAEKRLRQTLEEDPANQAALHYLSLVAETRHRQTLNPKDSFERFPGQRVKVSQGRQAMFSALDRIRFELVEFEKLPLQEIVRYLNEETRRRDPNGKGVNFIINPGSRPAEASAGQLAWTNISSLTITINPPLRDIRLADVLDAIVKVAETPLKYSIEDYAVVFSRKLNEPPALYTRVFKLDPNTFIQGLESVMGMVIPTAEPERSQALLPAIREFFTSTGVDLSSPKTLYYKDREGSLLVRATLADLDAIEAGVQILNVAPPQVNLKTRFYAVPQGLALPGPTNAPGSDPSTFTAILTPAQASVILKSLNSASGVELLGEASITTLSGRQAQIQTVDLQTVATNINPQAMSPPGVSTNALYLSTQVPVGPVFDVVAYVSADDHTVQLTATSTLTEFQGYDSATNYVRAYIGGKEISVALPLPRFSARQMTSTAVVWDGQTLVVGTVPAARSGEAGSNQLLALITPVIIDAAGNRVHKEN